MKTKAIRYFQTDRTLTRIVSPPLYDSRGEGANPKARAAFSHQLKTLKGYEIETVLAGDDGWNPVKNGNHLLDVKR
ncbi:hypothetical protein DW080_01180 [Bacteroides caccae]|nr:hypothetical protein DW080_01180 [Bacteroides caccae]